MSGAGLPSRNMEGLDDNMDTIPPNESSSTVTPRQVAWRRACVTCTKAKRQCTKQVPRCRRCVDKGLPCTYPPARRSDPSATAEIDETLFHNNSAVVPIEEGLTTGSADATNPLDASGEFAFSLLQMTEAELESFPLPTHAGPSGGLSQTTTASAALVSQGGTFWFLASESWTVEFHEPPPTTAHETERSLKQYIEQVRSWMRQWVVEGYSPIHHRELYSFHMPRHIQDAYSAMAMYMSRTRGNEPIVHRILEDRVSQLLQEQAVEASLGNGGEGGTNIFDRLSRIQALLCYQLIRLFDGDIRMRAQAEALIPTVSLWNREMLETVKDNLGRPERFLICSPFDEHLLRGGPDTAESPLSSAKTVWRAWILAESVRRTWQATSIVQGVYQFFKHSWAECPGRLPSTMRKTLWEAPSAYSWARELRDGKDPLLVPTARLEVLFACTSPAEVDAYNMASFRLYRMEKADQWLEEKETSKLQFLRGWESGCL